MFDVIHKQDAERALRQSYERDLRSPMLGGGGGGCPAVNTAWQITFYGSQNDGGATGGTWGLTISGLPDGSGGTTSNTATSIPYNVSTATLKTTIEALSDVGIGNVSVTGGPSAWVIEFISDLGNQYIGPLAIDVAGITSGYYFGATTTLSVQGHS